MADDPRKRFMFFDGMTWPIYDGDLAWRLLHAPDSVSPKEYAYIASVFSAYNELVHCGRTKREYVTKKMRGNNGNGDT